MRAIRALAIYILVVFVGGALIAPQLYHVVQSWSGTFPGLAGAPFHRYVHRCFLVLALAGLWPLLRSLGARSAADFGVVAPRGQFRKLGAGFAVGFISLALVATIGILAGARAFPEHLPVGKVAGRLAGALLTAAGVAVLEEVLFRGGIFGGLRRICDWRMALLASSAIYALVHFFAPARHEGPVTWLSGLALLGPLFSGFTDSHQLVPGFFNLSLVGALLALAYQRTGNLYCSIGMHSGWIFWLRGYKVLTREVPAQNVWLFGSDRMIDGWLAGIVLVVTLLGMLYKDAQKRRDREGPTPPT